MMRNNKLWIAFSLLTLITACGEDADYYPKPMGYMRVDFPERVYTRYAPECPYSFEIPDYFKVVDKDSFCNKKDIEMARFNATLNLTYMPVDTNLNYLIEKSRSLAYEHTIFADAINEVVVSNPASRTFGLIYDIEGDAASPFQFYLTDSSTHFMRGALYFNVKPNYDSVRTSLDYIREDLDRMIGSMNWEDQVTSEK